MSSDKEFETLKKSIGTKVKELRLQAGYKSYEVFAWDNRISRIQYWKMEKGTNCTLKSLQKVISIHDLDMIDFFNSLNK
ncbi:MAG: hypothetical protein P8M03_05245 [Flavobacteriaceae bacterium]|nr:hypothetical protein [Flavobacteriaceae bacterium]